MKKIPFEKLYNTDFFLSEPSVKPQYWAARGSIYSCLKHPKISHTLLWFKNCSGTVTDREGNVIECERNQLIYTPKGSEYVVEFHDTNLDKEDSYVMHFQLYDHDMEDIIPTDKPIICIKNVDSVMAEQIERAAEEFGKNVVCIPEMQACIYKLLSTICQKQKRRTVKKKYALILPAIELLEEGSPLSIAEIAQSAGVSVCYFRRLFTEYSGESPVQFRQHYRIEKAKQLLFSDEEYSIGEIAQLLGFTDIYHFSKTFKKYMGVSPTQYVDQRQSAEEL